MKLVIANCLVTPDTLLEKFIRKIFYKIFVYLRIIPGIDNIYFLCKDNKTNVLRICFDDKVKFLDK